MGSSAKTTRLGDPSKVSLIRPSQSSVRQLLTSSIPFSITIPTPNSGTRGWLPYQRFLELRGRKHLLEPWGPLETLVRGERANPKMEAGPEGIKIAQDSAEDFETWSQEQKDTRLPHLSCP